MLKNQVTNSTPLHKSFKPLVCLLLGGVAPIGLMLTAKPATALTVGFQGDYAPINWANTISNNNGNVNTTNAPTSITLNANNNSSGTPGSVSFTINAPVDSTVAFDWSYFVFFDAPHFEPLYFILNGSQNAVSAQPTSSDTLTGSNSFNVLAGDEFGFRIATSDNVGGANANATFSNFSVTPVPFEFSPVLGLTMLGVGYGVKRLCHRKKATKL